MPGIEEFGNRTTLIGDLILPDGEALNVLLSGVKERLLTSNTVYNTEIAASANEAINVLSTADTLAIIRRLWLSATAPAGASSGTHKFSIGIGSLVGAYDYLIEVQAAYNSTLRISSVAGLGSGSTVVTGNGFTTFAEFQNFCMNGGILIGEGATNRLRIQYFNNTDVATTESRRIAVQLQERGVYF